MLYIDVMFDDEHGVIAPYCDADKMWITDGKTDRNLELLIKWRQKTGRQRKDYTPKGNRYHKDDE